MPLRLRSIRTKLLAVFLATAVLPLVLLSVISYRNSSQAVVDMVGNRTERLAQSVRLELERKLGRRVQDRLLVTNQQVQDFLSQVRAGNRGPVARPLESLRLYMVSLFGQYGDYYDELVLADADSEPIVRYDRLAGTFVSGDQGRPYPLPAPPPISPVGAPEGAVPPFRGGVLSGITPPFSETDRALLKAGPSLAAGGHRLHVDTGERGRSPIVSLLLPVQSNERPQVRLGYVLVRMRPDYLWPQDLATRRFGDQGHLAIVDGETGDVLYHTQSEWIGRPLKQVEPENSGLAASARGPDAGAGPAWTLVRGSQGGRVATVLGVSGTPWRVLATAAPGEFASEARRAALFTLVIAILVLLAAAAVLVLASGRISRSIHVLTAGARRIAGGDLSEHRIEVETHDEVQTLAEAFNVMTASLRRSIALREQAVAELDALNRSLESRVQERTRELETLNLALNQANDELKELDRLKSSFLATVSHEFKTPLTSIKAFAEILHDELQERNASEELTRFLRIIDTESDRLGRLIKNVLDLSRIESGRIVWRTADFPARDVVEAAVDGLLPALNEKRIRIDRDLGCGDVLLRGDPDRIQEVVGNVLDNAIKASDEGQSIVIGCHEEAGRANGEPRMLRIYVKDHGHGIPAGETERIFDRFYQVGGSARRRKGGTGLGLAISREIAEHHGGRIWAESEPGKGSTFHIALPLAAPPGVEAAHSPDVDPENHPHA